MFIDVNYNKQPQKAKLHLAKPNKKVISILHEKMQDEMNVKLGNISELNFSIPYMIDQDGVNIENPNIELIRERMLIRVSLGGLKEWFIVDNIEESGESGDIFNVKCFSLGYELKDTRVSSLTEESINASDLLVKILENTLWKIGEVDAMFDAMYRQFDSGEDSNALDTILKAAETYGALLIWDTENRRVSFKDIKKNGTYRGLHIDYGRFLQTIKRTRTTDEMVTRMYIYGSEGLGIESVNPTGLNYIEDFSYFMYPFERDANGNIIKSSYFMSDELCIAIEDHKSLTEANSPIIKNLMNDLMAKNEIIVADKALLNQYQLELRTIEALLDVALATEDEALISAKKSERAAKQSQIDSQTSKIASTQTEINNINLEIQRVQNNISNQANFTPELLDELKLYVIEKEWSDDRYIDAQELYEDGLKKFNELRQPKIVIEVGIDNLFNVIEEQYYWDKLVLGDIVKVKYPQMKLEYKAKIIEIKYNLENGDAQLVIANTSDLMSEYDKLIQLLYKNSGASNLIQANKYKWDKINAVEKEVMNLISSEWDATKNKIIAGVNNSVEVGRRGIIIKNPDYPDEVIILQSGVIALSQDRGESWKTAIKPDGIVAERLIGKIIAGQELLITNNSGTFTFDNNGVRISADAFVIESSSGSNLVEKWINSSDFIDEYRDDNIITAFEKKMLKIEWDKLYPKHLANVEKITNYYGDEATSYEFINVYNNRYNELYNYLFVDLLGGTKPMLAEDNMAYSTRVDSSIFESKFRNYDNAFTELEKQLAIRSKLLADSAMREAMNAQKEIEEVANDIVYKIELTSSMGLTFKNGNVQTSISARVYRGKDDITDIIPKSGFIWEKYDRSGALDTVWKNSMIGIGNTITVNTKDVYQRTTFKCSVDIPE